MSAAGSIIVNVSANVAPMEQSLQNSGRTLTSFRSVWRDSLRSMGTAGALAAVGITYGFKKAWDGISATFDRGANAVREAMKKANEEGRSIEASSGGMFTTEQASQVWAIDEAAKSLNREFDIFAAKQVNNSAPYWVMLNTQAAEFVSLLSDAVPRVEELYASIAKVPGLGFFAEGEETLRNFREAGELQAQNQRMMDRANKINKERADALAASKKKEMEADRASNDILNELSTKLFEARGGTIIPKGLLERDIAEFNKFTAAIAEEERLKKEQEENARKAIEMEREAERAKASALAEGMRMLEATYTETEKITQEWERIAELQAQGVLSREDADQVRQRLTGRLEDIAGSGRGGTLRNAAALTSGSSEAFSAITRAIQQNSTPRDKKAEEQLAESKRATGLLETIAKNTAVADANDFAGAP